MPEMIPFGFSLFQKKKKNCCNALARLYIDLKQEEWSKLKSVAKKKKKEEWSKNFIQFSCMLIDNYADARRETCITGMTWL